MSGRHQSQRDASCQTTLTLPVDFDLIALVGQQFYTYVDEAVYHHPAAACSKGDTAITASTLRRKLFDQEPNFGDTGDACCDDDGDVGDDNDDYRGRLRLPTMSSSKLPDTPGIKFICFFQSKLWIFFKKLFYI